MPVFNSSLEPQCTQRLDGGVSSVMEEEAGERQTVRFAWEV